MRDPHDPSFSRNHSPARSWPGAQPSSPDSASRIGNELRQVRRCGTSSAVHYRSAPRARCSSATPACPPAPMRRVRTAWSNVNVKRRRPDRRPQPAPYQNARRVGARGAAAGETDRREELDARAARRTAARTAATNGEALAADSRPRRIASDRIAYDGVTFAHHAGGFHPRPCAHHHRRCPTAGAVRALGQGRNPGALVQPRRDSATTLQDR